MPVSYPIKDLYAWIVDDPTEEHGIIAIRVMGGLGQAVTSKRAIADRMKPDAEFIASKVIWPVKLQRFVFVETVDEIVRP